METNSWKAFRDTGKARFGEFGTPLPSLMKSLWNIAVQATGLGQGFTDNSNVRPLRTQQTVNGKATHADPGSTTRR